MFRSFFVYLQKYHFMITFRYYDKDKRIDHVWYESSNILYSECDDNVDALKTLRVTFKNGDTYEYKDVDVNDYLLFATGGKDASNGKTFHKIIRPKYEYRKLDNIPPEQIALLLEDFKDLKEQETITEDIKEPEAE